MVVYGKETYIEVGGAKYRLARFDRSVWSDFLVWSKSQLPDYIGEAKKLLDCVPEAERSAFVEKILDKASSARSINSPEVQELLNSPEGTTFVLCRLLQKYQPELTEDQAWEILEGAMTEHGPEYIAGKIAETQGTLPAEKKV